MKKSNRLSLPVFLYAICFVAALASCTSAKQLTYLQDVSPNQTIKGLPLPPVYKIRVGDNLFVSVSAQDAEMSKLIDPANGNNNVLTYEGQASKALNGNIVRIDGTINLPMLGNVAVAGKTIVEAEDMIRQSATKDYLKDVAVKVRVLSYKVTLVGEVKAPGVYYNYNSFITIFDAIGLAQGTTDFAKLQDVLVLRNTATGAKTYSLNLNSKSSLELGSFLSAAQRRGLPPTGKNKGIQQKLPFATVVVGSLSAIFLLLNYLHN